MAIRNEDITIGGHGDVAVRVEAAGTADENEI